METKKAFSKRLFTLYKESKCKTLSEFAGQIGISRQSLDHYVNGTRIPPANYLRQIAEKTGVSTDWLVGLSDFRTHEAEKATAAELGINEASIDILRNMRLWGDMSAAKCIDTIAADIGFTRSGNRTLADLINFYLAFEYRGGNQAIDQNGMIFNPGGERLKDGSYRAGLPQGAIRVNQQLIESALLQEITTALRALKQASQEAKQNGQSLIEFYREQASQEAKQNGKTLIEFYRDTYLAQTAYQEETQTETP